MEEFWELPTEIQEYIRSHELPLQMYSSPVGDNKGFEGLKPKSGIVTAIIQNESEDFLFLKHSEEGRFWELPSGHIKEGEHPDDAITREVLEETGYEISKLKPVLAILWPFENTVRVQIVFSAKVGKQVKGTNAEADELKWHSEIPENVTFGEFGHKIYNYYINALESESDNKSYFKQGVALLGAAVSVAALRSLQKYRSDSDDPENES